MHIIHNKQIKLENEKKTKDSLNLLLFFPSSVKFFSEKNITKVKYLVIFIKIPANPIPVDIAIIQLNGKKLTIPYMLTIHSALARPRFKVNIN